MSNSYILSCESTVDMPYSYVSGRNISVLFYTYCVGGTEYVDDMCRTKDALPHFYQMLAAGKTPKTSQINEFSYEEYFEGLLKESNVVHIAFGSGMTPSVNNAKRAAQLLKEKYPERKIAVIDSLCSCCGYGMLVDMAADMRDSGAEFDETVKFVEDIKMNIHHQFFSTDIKYFKRSGRISGPAAAVATVLGICPIMHLDENGRIVAYDKVRGKNNAISKTVEEVVKHAKDNEHYNGRFYIGHSNCFDMAKETAECIEKKMKGLKGKIKILDIGTIIASHCGPGTVAVFFVGDER